MINNVIRMTVNQKTVVVVEHDTDTWGFSSMYFIIY